MMKILFRSTNREVPEATFKEVIFKGQPEDYGLYMPVFIPSLRRDEIEMFRQKSYTDIATDIIRRFTADEIPLSKLEQMVLDAYNFDVPLQRVHNGFYLLWLTKGPTASFKDFAARILARMMEYFAKEEGRKITVLVATSGDTGGAVASAFYNLENVRVVVLFPYKEVTERQRRQMTTLGGNISAVAVDGKFDDCQAIVKISFNDGALQHLSLTSANSINFGRLLPQMVYYFYAYSRLDAEDVVFSVPSGNFGNLMGGVFAKRMGLPVRRFVVAVNENDEFPNFLQTGNYQPVVPSKECSSNAMNVGHPSNLARLVDLYGGHLTDERDKATGKVIRKGVLKVAPDMERMRNDFVSYSVSEEEVDEVIVRFYKRYGVLVEPHGAVGIKAAEKSGEEPPLVSLETADPAKFPEKIRGLLGIEPPIPPSLAGLDNKKESFEFIGNDYEEFKRYLLNKNFV
ncbi:MAG: threonine synthase [Candidatus Ratteibacteria bacterium]|nr:threonine synthase [Candidatus Ratteibacteria bacterium]